MHLQPVATAFAPEGMVCAVDHLAADAGVAMLRNGGSAADAAVACSAVLAVTTQHMCGLGGDLLAVVAPPGETPVALNASGRAGSGADPDRLRAEGFSAMPLRGDVRSVTVPGCVDGWLALHARFGHLPLGDVLEPARRYAQDGFPATPSLVAALPDVAHLPDAADYTEHGSLRVGTRIRRLGVARTLAGISAGGREAFYGGEFGAGLLALGPHEFTAADLARPLADWTPALDAEAWGHRVWTVPPNSQGYLTLAGAWIAAGLDLPGDPDDPQWAHLLIEAARQAAQDRVAVLHELADGRALIDPARLGPRRAAIDPTRVSPVGGSSAPGGTIALCAVDGQRLGVSVVQSNAAGFGSHLVVPGVRIFLHNRGIGFSLEPGHPGEYAPGRRPGHTLCPTLVTRPDGRLRGVLGTMGGDSQPQILLQVLARWIAAGESPGPAIAAARWALTSGPTVFDTWRAPDTVKVLIEGHAPAPWAPGLAALGHTVLGLGAFDHAFGHAQLISVEADHLAGGSDPRPGSGGALGY
jgi:gamma-glutamyltranspeptidase/glutathione hydrolase